MRVPTDMFTAARIAVALTFPLVSFGALVASAPAPVVASGPPCAAGALRLSVQLSDAFDGMSHAGGYAVVRNVAETACSFSALPALTMRAPDGAVVAIGETPSARFMHPGPVVLPIELGPGASAASALRWVNGNVYGDTNATHVETRSLALSVGSKTISAPLKLTLWGPAAKTIAFEMQRFTTALPALDAAAPSAAGTYVAEGPAGAAYVAADGTPWRELVLTKASNGAFDFRFNGLGGSDVAPNQGEIAGRLVPEGTHATFRDPKDDCTFAVAFFGGQLTVAQTGLCGFGNGVTATGQYRLQ